jgi:hypothetical protein
LATPRLDDEKGKLPKSRRWRDKDARRRNVLTRMETAADQQLVTVNRNASRWVM